ncbi:MAG: NAD(P)-binding domain-containing protein [Candidatus Eremiobacteraeota bacterium]|nr:NAD(P)-binding domain-containing protein [Candidatus Eremiobacteraeota bacterium]
MVIGIIGADDRAVAIGRLLKTCGHEISFSDPIDQSRAEKARDAHGSATVCTTYDQAATCEAIVMAVHWEDLDKTLAALGSYKKGVVIDATRPPKLEGSDNGAQLLEKKLDNRHVVKAFVEEPVPRAEVRVASDDPNARMMVCEMIDSCGGKAVDMGPLSAATEMEASYANDVSTTRGAT